MRAIMLDPVSVIQMLLSGPVTNVRGPEPVGNMVITPAVVIRTALLLHVNQRLLSGPAVMPDGTHDSDHSLKRLTQLLVASQS